MDNTQKLVVARLRDGGSFRGSAPSPDVSWAALFPDPEGNLRRTSNQAARAAYGDDEVKRRIADASKYK